MAPLSGDIPRQTFKSLKATKSPPNAKPSASRSRLRPPEKEYKSAEFVVDSSDEEERPRDSQKQTGSKTQVLSTPREKAVGPSKKQASKDVKTTVEGSAKIQTIRSKKDTPKTKANGMKPKQPSPSSSDESEEGGKSSAAKPAPRSSKSSKSEDSSSSEEEEEEEREKPKLGTAAKRGAPEEATNGNKNSSEDTSESDSDDGSDNNSDDSSKATSQNATSLSKGLTKQQDAHSAEVRPVQPFDPPDGFEAVEDVALSSRLHELFDQSTLAGKQLWYITAPANVPISLDNIDLNHVAKGVPLIRHEGRDYTLVNERESSIKTSIMLPGEEGYEMVPSTITQVMHLQQSVRLPHIPTPSVPQTQPPQDTHDSDEEPQKPKKEQPKGLRMRYRPSGFRGEKLGIIGSGSSEDDDILYATADTLPTVRQPPPTFRLPPSLVADSSSPKKRKKREDDRAEEPSPKKSKKDKSVGGENEASSQKEKKKKERKHENSISDSMNAGRPLAMTVLQTSNANAIETTAPETPRVESTMDGSAKEKKKKKKHKDRTHNEHSASKLKNISQTSMSLSADLAEELVKEKDKKDKKRYAVKDDSASAVVAGEAMIEELPASSVSAASKAVSIDFGEEGNAVEKEKKKKNKHKHKNRHKQNADS